MAARGNTTAKRGIEAVLAARLPGVLSAGAGLRRRATVLARLPFPWTAPTTPGGVEPLPKPSKLGVDYDTSWARRPTVRIARRTLLDALVRPAVHLVAAPSVAGDHHVDRVRGPAIFCANHASHLDTPLLLTCLPDRIRHRVVVAAAADYFFDARAKAVLAAGLLNAVPMERVRVHRGSALFAAELIESGWHLVIYPEGGRTPDGWGQPWKGGAAYLSLRTGAPIVPVHIEGTRRLLAKGARHLVTGSTRVAFGAPMYAAEGEDARRFAARVESAVALLAHEAATDWYTARLAAGRGETPPLSGPDTSPWRRTWALGPGGRTAGVPPRTWPRR